MLKQTDSRQADPRPLVDLGRQILLTKPEYQCYRVVQQVRRKQLIDDLAFARSLPLTDRLVWAKQGFRLFLQVLVFVVLVPFLVLWNLLSYVVKLLRFPVLWCATYLVPRGLVPPGEKNIVGMHNAFGRYLNVNLANYTECVEQWVKLLYGEEQAQQYSFNDTLWCQLEGVSGVTPQTSINDIVIRRYLAAARETLSKKLGYYSALKREEPDREKVVKAINHRS